MNSVPGIPGQPAKLTDKEQAWLQEVLSSAEWQQAAELPVELLRELYSGILSYGPQEERIKQAAQLFADLPDLPFDSHMRFSLRQMANAVYGVFHVYHPTDSIYLYAGRLNRFSEAICDSSNYVEMLGILASVAGEGIYPPDSQLERRRKELEPSVLQEMKILQSVEYA